MHTHARSAKPVRLNHLREQWGINNLIYSSVARWLKKLLGQLSRRTHLWLIYCLFTHRPLVSDFLVEPSKRKHCAVILRNAADVLCFCVRFDPSFSAHRWLIIELMINTNNQLRRNWHINCVLALNFLNCWSPNLRWIISCLLIFRNKNISQFFINYSIGLFFSFKGAIHIRPFHNFEWRFSPDFFCFVL